MSTKSQPAPTQSTDEPSTDWSRQLRWLAPITVGILLVATLFLVIQSQKNNSRTEMLNAYGAAETGDDFEIFANSFKDEPEAALARLQAGSRYYNEGDYESAKVQYLAFQENFPNHPMLDQARWGGWMSEEALGNHETALAGFKSVKEDEKLYPMALLARARLSEKQGDPEQALMLYAEVKETYPRSGWAEQAKTFSKRIQVQQD